MLIPNNFTPIRACIFDMDGLLIDSEDIYTNVINIILRENGRPEMPWSIKAQLQGRPGPAATKIFMDWAQLPIPYDQYKVRLAELHRQYFPTCRPLPGVLDLLDTLAASSSASVPHEKMEMALATSSVSVNVELKTAHMKHLFKHFPESQRIVGDDPRVPQGRGKPAPDIYLLALRLINERRASEGKDEIRPEECLVFEDSVPGAESGRRAGMKVVWVPHPGLLNEYKGKEDLVLAGGMGEANRDDGHGLILDKGTPGEIGDGGGELRDTLENFDYARYGILLNN